MRRVSLLLAALGVLSLVVAISGCGGSSGTPTSGVTTAAKGGGGHGGGGGGGGGGGSSYAYTLVDLGPSGSTACWAEDINSSGQVVGYWVDGASVRHPFVWSQSAGIVELSGFSGESAYAVGINDLGDVVGAADFGSGMHAFLWKGGAITDLGTAGMPRSAAHKINNSDQVAGFVSNDTLSDMHGFFWSEATGMIDLGTLGGSYCSISDINEAGQIAGQADLPGDTKRDAFLWQIDGGMTDLGALGSVGSAAYGLNNANPVQVVGWSGNGRNLPACIWQGGAITALPLLKGSSSAAAIDITDDGQAVVGRWYDRSSVQHACIWNKGVAADLNKQIDPSLEWDLGSAAAVNSAGWIAGWGVVNGQTHGFVLVPKGAAG